MRKKPSGASISDAAASALAIEKEGKIGGADDDERIEDVIHEHDDEHLEDGHSTRSHDSRGRNSKQSRHHTLTREDLLPPHLPLDRDRSVSSFERRSEDSSIANGNGKQKEVDVSSQQAML